MSHPLGSFPGCYVIPFSLKGQNMTVCQGVGSLGCYSICGSECINVPGVKVYSHKSLVCQ